MSNFIQGQKALDRLLSDVSSGTVSHAYILSGPRGIGKKTTALIFAAALHCTGERKPCGICPACVKHRANTHPDVSMIEPEENGNLRIGAVRAATDELFMRPLLAERKVLIVDGADGMAAPAQNAMLKPFEEPPEYGTIVLLSENIQNILPTIRSRGVKLELEPFSRDKIKTFVEREYPALKDKSGFVAGYSGGIIGRARDICEDEEFFTLRVEMFNALSGLSGMKDCIFPIAELFGINKRKVDADHRAACFDLMLSFLGDALALKTGGEAVNIDLIDRIRAFSSGVTAGGLTNAIERVASTMAELNASMRYDLWIVDMLIKCWRDLHGNSSRN
ncbi:MAG: hypothetical protein J1F63_06640 [Oscillospiraceae bacterium]|nr:hypothetical protein [Oscillospiraceae bacterium]